MDSIFVANTDINTIHTIWDRGGEMEGVLVTGREAGRIWGWAETPNVRVTGDKDKLVTPLEAPSLHRWTHHTSCWQKHDGAVQNRIKKRTIVIFTFFCSSPPSFHHHPTTPLTPSVPPWQLGEVCIHLFYLISGGKSRAVTQSIGVAFCPELMKSHAYWNQLYVLPWRRQVHHKDLCFKARRSQWLLPWPWQSSLFLSVPCTVIDCDTEKIMSV